MAVRRAAWDEAGGFPGDVRSDADVELCWRIQAAGWALEYRPDALVVHRDPERVARDLAPGGRLRRRVAAGSGACTRARATARRC